MDYTCKNEGRPNERNIYDRYECCQRTVLDTPGMLLLSIQLVESVMTDGNVLSVQDLRLV